MAKITKCSQLLAIMQELSPKITPTLDDALWWVSMQEAEDYMDMGTKDMARLICKGNIRGNHTEEDVDEYLDMCDYHKTSLKAALKEFGYTKDYVSQEKRIFNHS